MVVCGGVVVCGRTGVDEATGTSCVDVGPVVLPDDWVGILVDITGKSVVIAPGVVVPVTYVDIGLVVIELVDSVGVI